MEIENRVSKDLTLKETQDILSCWFVSTGLIYDQSILETYLYACSELNETKLELDKNPIDKEALGLEIADTITTLINLATLCGIDLQTAIKNQLDKQYCRYNPHNAKLLVEQGLSPKQALRNLKEDYLQLAKK